MVLCSTSFDGPDRQTLEAAARKLELTDNVQFLGSRADVPDILKVLDIFTLSSDREGHPLTALEAQAAGIPVVLTDVGGSADALSRDGEQSGGLLVSADAQKLAEGLLKLLNDTELRQKMSLFAAAYTREHFGLSRMVHDYETLMASVAV